METLIFSLFIRALQTTAAISLFVVTIVAVLGVLIGIVQTILQVQDSNVAFAPKLAAVAVIAATCGATAFDALLGLFGAVIAALPHIGRA